MKLLVAVDKHFFRYKQEYYTDGTHPYKYWQEYLEVFDKVFVLARIQEVSFLENHFHRADGLNVELCPLPGYKGPVGLIMNSVAIVRDCFKAISKSDVVLMRSGNVGLCLWLCLKIKKRPYAVEHGGALNESIVFAKKFKAKWLNRFFAVIVHKLHQKQARQATCASYVCKYLKQLYPTKDETKEFVFSGVQLKDDCMSSPRNIDQFQGNTIISVGRLMPEKGHKILIDAVEKINCKIPDLKVLILGDGPLLKDLREYVSVKGFQNIIELPGRVKWGTELFDLLDSSKLFVIPSFTEGMPRALIEAMARGLPAVGSRAGGIPEILADKYLVEPGNPSQLADKIISILNDENELAKMSKENYEKALCYKPCTMQKIKLDFWRCLANND